MATFPTLSFFFALIASKDTGQDSQVVLVDHAGIVLVKSHHHTHGGTEESDITMRNVLDQPALQQQLPCSLQSTGQAVQSQLHLTTGGLNQDGKARDDTIDKVTITKKMVRRETKTNKQASNCNTKVALVPQTYIRLDSLWRNLRIKQGT